jgi:hypothetical protein
MMSANAPPKISAMTSSVMSRICHQRIFFFFFPFPPLPLPPFLPDFLPFALRGASSSSRGGLQLPPLPPAAPLTNPAPSRPSLGEGDGVRSARLVHYI